MPEKFYAKQQIKKLIFTTEFTSKCNFIQKDRKKNRVSFSKNVPKMRRRDRKILEIKFKKNHCKK